MTEAAKGNLPRAETSSVPSEQKKKGVGIGGKLNFVKGTSLNTRGDKQARKLKKLWGKAKNAKSKFGTFAKNL